MPSSAQSLSASRQPRVRPLVLVILLAGLMGWVSRYATLWVLGAEGVPVDWVRDWRIWVPASILTWLILLKSLGRAERIKIGLLGVLSVFLLAFFVLVGAALWFLFAEALPAGQAALAIELIAAAPTRAVIGVALTAPVSVPLGVAAAFLIRFALQRWGR